jgi:hypothetical protein
MPKADQALSARRVSEILQIRLDGARIWDVLDYVREKEAEQDSAWFVGPDAKPLSDSMIRKYQEKADGIFSPERCSGQRLRTVRPAFCVCARRAMQSITGLATMG